jgi:large subunit ribosomal protein L22
MKATLNSVRIAPKKLNLIARMVRALPVPVAVEALRKTNKKGARIVEKLLLSAIANASFNDKQDPQMMIVKTIVVNQGQALRRGMPKARGQMRPYKKFFSHLEITLGYPTEKSPKRPTKPKSEGKAGETAKKPSQKGKNHVKKTSSKDTETTSSVSSVSSVSSN